MHPHDLRWCICVYVNMVRVIRIEFFIKYTQTPPQPPTSLSIRRIHIQNSESVEYVRMHRTMHHTSIHTKGLCGTFVSAADAARRCYCKAITRFRKAVASMPTHEERRDGQLRCIDATMQRTREYCMRKYYSFTNKTCTQIPNGVAV